MTFELPALALDIGMTRIGVAVSDQFGYSSRGVRCLYRKDQQWCQQCMKLVAEYGCRTLVIGLAKNMDGSEGTQAKDCRKAAELLRQYCNIPIVFQDERLSTWTAKERLYAQGLNEKKVRERLDQTAAAIILEDYLAAVAQH